MRARRLDRIRSSALLLLIIVAGVACQHPSLSPVEVDSGVIDPTSDTAQASIPVENQAAGYNAWKVSTPAPPESLAVWASPYVVSAGDTLKIYVQSIHDSLTVDIYRLGWYQGNGGRLLDRSTIPTAQVQPACTPPFPGPVSCPWQVSLTRPIDPGWTGGVYLVRVQDRQGNATAYPFVVRSRHPHAFMAIVPQFTWQAYNRFGGSSLYTTDPTTHYTVPAVSFARPYSKNATQGTLGGTYDFSAIRWLERTGVDVGYLSDLDLAGSSVTTPEAIHGLIFIGHGEYWSWNERVNVEQMRDAGKHLAFLGANNAYWNIRLGAGPVTSRDDEVITRIGHTPDPGATSVTETTVKFRDPPLGKPENALYGIMFDGLIQTGPASTPSYFASPDSMRGPEATSFLAAAGLHAGDSLGVQTTAEGDGVVNNGLTPPGLQTILLATQPTLTGGVQIHRATFFVAPSGAGVFASGSNWWTIYMDNANQNEDRHIEGITEAVIDWMSAH